MPESDQAISYKKIKPLDTPTVYNYALFKLNMPILYLSSKIKESPNEQEH